MRLTVSRTALSLAVLMTGCQSPSLRENWFTKNPFASNKQASAPTQPQVAGQQPPQPQVTNPTGTQTASVPLQPAPQTQQPPAPQTIATRPAQSPILQTGATMPAQQARPIGANSERVRADLDRGESALRTKRYTEAKLAFENVLNVDPQNLQAHHRLGQVYDLTQNFAEAERHYLNALSLQPNNPDVLSDFGYSYVLQGRFEDALEKLNRATAIDPTHKTALLNTGAAYAGMGETNRALYYFRKVVPEDKASELLTNELQRSITRNKTLLKRQSAPTANLEGMSASDLQREMARIQQESNALQERHDYLRGQLESYESQRREAAVKQLQFESNRNGGVPSWKNRANGIPEDQLNSRLQNMNRGDAGQWGGMQNDGQPGFNQPPAFPSNNGDWNGGAANNFNSNGFNGGGFNPPQPGVNSFNSNGINPNFNINNGPTAGSFNPAGAGSGIPQFPGNNSYNSSENFVPNQPNLLQPNGAPSFGGSSSFSNGFGPGSGLPNQPFGGQPTGNNFGNAAPNMMLEQNSFGGSSPNGFGNAQNMSLPGPLGSSTPNNVGASNFGGGNIGTSPQLPAFNPAEGFGGVPLNGAASAGNFANNMPSPMSPAPAMNPGAWTPGARSGFGGSAMPNTPMPNGIQQSGGPMNNVGDPGVKQLLEATQLGMGAGPGALFNFSDASRQPSMGAPGGNSGMGLSGNGIPFGTPSMGTPPLSTNGTATSVDPNRFRQMPTWGGAGR